VALSSKAISPSKNFRRVLLGCGCSVACPHAIVRRGQRTLHQIRRLLLLPLAARRC